jgi:NitT/TauT family transport system substrate-binding protein
MRHFRLDRHRPNWMIIFAVLLVALAGCGGKAASGSTDAGPEMAKITVGTLPIVDSAALYLAKKKGYFAAEGLDVDLKSLSSGAVAVPGLHNGDL